MDLDIADGLPEKETDLQTDEAEMKWKIKKNLMMSQILKTTLIYHYSRSVVVAILLWGSRNCLDAEIFQNVHIDYRCIIQVVLLMWSSCTTKRIISMMIE